MRGPISRRPRIAASPQTLPCCPENAKDARTNRLRGGEFTHLAAATQGQIVGSRDESCYNGTTKCYEPGPPEPSGVVDCLLAVFLARAGKLSLM